MIYQKNFKGWLVGVWEGLSLDPSKLFWVSVWQSKQNPNKSYGWRCSDVRGLLEKHTGLIEVMLERQKTLEQNMNMLLDLIDKQPQDSYPVKEADNFHGSGPEKQALTSYIVPTDKSGGNVQTSKLLLKLYLRQVSKLICKTTVIMTAKLKILAFLKMVTLLKTSQELRKLPDTFYLETQV